MSAYLEAPLARRASVFLELHGDLSGRAGEPTLLIGKASRGKDEARKDLRPSSWAHLLKYHKHSTQNDAPVEGPERPRRPRPPAIYVADQLSVREGFDSEPAKSLSSGCKGNWILVKGRKPWVCAAGKI